MRTLILLRGAPGCGKSTWIKEHHLEDYTIGADELRLQMTGPTVNLKGKPCIEQDRKVEPAVWEELYKILEFRLGRGEFTVFNATNTKTQEMTNLRNLANKYKYRVYLVDFTDIPIDEVKRRNHSREPMKVVPDEVIDKAYSRFATQQVPSGIKVIRPDEFDTVLLKPLDLSQYKVIHHFGDIHGCFDTLMEVLNGIGGIKEDEFYIFLGDYLDRGPKNVEMVKFMLENMNRPNVLFLTGNHERELGIYSRLQHDFTAIKKGSFTPRIVKAYLFQAAKSAGQTVSKISSDVLYKYLSKGDCTEEEAANCLGYISPILLQGEFPLGSPAYVAMAEMLNAGIDPKDVSKLYRKLGQCAWYTYHGKTVFACHGGLSNLNFVDNPVKISLHDMVYGIGDYTEAGAVAEAWNLTMDGTIQFFGHRNMEELPIQVNDTVICLNGCPSVETTGGKFRWADLDAEGIHPHEMDTIDKITCAPTNAQPASINADTPVADLVRMLRESKDVEEKDMGDGISSFNFTREAFIRHKFNSLSSYARGLFINTIENRIVARGYEKFFKVEETDATSLFQLKTTLKFPVHVYKKYNGYLGIVTHSSDGKDFYICSKSTDKGTYAQGVRETVLNELGGNASEFLKYLTDNDATALFEVIRPEEDPHIISYTHPEAVLLDVMKNTVKMEKLPYEELVSLAARFGLPVKELAFTLKNWKEFLTFHTAVEEPGYQYKGNWIEGFVIEDSDGFMVKEKTYYYDSWKKLRGVATSYLKRGYFTKTSLLVDPVQNRFYGWLRENYDQLKDMRSSHTHYMGDHALSIVDLREMSKIDYEPLK